MSKRLSVFLILVVAFICSFNVRVVSAQITDTEVAKYASKWADNKNILYVWGGGSGMTLEEMDKTKTGTDCSGFTSAVYRHFGIELPHQSEAQKSAAVKTFTDEKDAVPGDICWWSGHVAIYIGNGKIVHTNTSRPPTNYIHFSDVGYRGTMPVFCRMVDDVSKLKPISGSEDGDTSSSKATSNNTINNVITESDLTGMPIKSTLIEEQKKLELKGRESLNESELETLAYIQTSLKSMEPVTIHWYNVLMVFGGILCIFYAILMFACYLLDYNNVFIEFSTLGIITLGRFRIIDQYDRDQGIVKPGWDADRRVTYVTFRMIAFRVVVILVVGILLVSGYINSWISSILDWIGWRLF